MKAQIYTTNKGEMAYQYGSTSRTIVSLTGCHQFQKKENGEWRNGRNSYAHDLVQKVKAILAS